MTASHRQTRLAVVIPTLNEAEHLPLLLRDLRLLDLPHHVVVCDGGSTDSTPQLARSEGALVVGSAPGRGHQLNRGAWGSAAPWLLFLHADCRLPPLARDAIRRQLLASPDPPTDTAFHFRFQMNERRISFRLLELGQRLREVATGLVYGDQGLLVGRELFMRCGGFPPFPVMEDVEFIRRIRGAGARIRALPAALPTSGRRYAHEGVVRGGLRNGWLLARYLSGASPQDLAEQYAYPSPRKPKAETTSGKHGRILLFTKAPRPGSVKTRLAREMGDEAACAIYRQMGADTVTALAGLPYPLEVRYTPDDSQAEQEVRRWLEPQGATHFVPQGPGDLGARMAAAISQGVGDGRRVCVVGADLPQMNPQLIVEAYSAMDNGADLVLGPALDGGYYLLATGALHPQLFHGMEWSQARVLQETLARAHNLDLSVYLLPPLRDVDTLEDLRLTAPSMESLAPTG
ncbi:MAG: TIGR04283 family arsenosugar biosynthesis glycosyltransferase [Gemmatimonadota bacterium]